MAVYLEQIPTPNPAEFSIRVKQDANTLAAFKWPTIGLAYEDSAFTPKPRVQEFHDYTYAYAEKSGDDVWFYYVKPKTPEERNTPFKTSYSTRYYPWPPVLYALKLIRTWRLPNAIWNGSKTEDAPRYFVRYRMKPTPNVSSVIRIDQYLSEIPYPKSVLTHPQPIAGEINASGLGWSVSIPKCLHPKTAFFELVPGAQEVPNCGTDNFGAFLEPGRTLFPATNFLDWAAFVLEDQVQPTGGQYLREKITIVPPAEPEIITQ